MSVGPCLPLVFSVVLEEVVDLGLLHSMKLAALLEGLVQLCERTCQRLQLAAVP